MNGTTQCTGFRGSKVCEVPEPSTIVILVVALVLLAAVLSTQAEQNPRAAHRVNVEGTFNLLQLAVDQTQRRGEPVIYTHLYTALFNVMYLAKRGVLDLNNLAAKELIKELFAARGNHQALPIIDNTWQKLQSP